MRSLIWILCTAFPAVAMAGAEFRGVECTATWRTFPVRLILSAESFMMFEQDRPDRASPVISTAVKGRGASARTVVRYRDGEFSYQDAYGCVKEAQGTFKDGKFEDLKCEQKGSACAATQASKKDSGK